MAELIDYGLCSFQDVLSVLKDYGGSSPANQDFIERLINYFTVEAEGTQYCDRRFPKGDYTEYKHGGLTYFRVDAPPIALTDEDPLTPTIQVWEDGDRDYGAESLLDVWDDYIVDVKWGFIVSRWGCFEAEPMAIKTTYTGGLVDIATGSTPPIAPIALRNAAALQVATWWNRRRELGLEVASLPGGGTFRLMQDPTKLVDTVYKTLLDYRVLRGVG